MSKLIRQPPPGCLKQEVGTVPQSGKLHALPGIPISISALLPSTLFHPDHCLDTVSRTALFQLPLQGPTSNPSRYTPCALPGQGAGLGHTDRRMGLRMAPPIPARTRDWLCTASFISSEMNGILELPWPHSVSFTLSGWNSSQFLFFSPPPKHTVSVHFTGDSQMTRP